jgi:fatty acid synthase
LQVGDLEELKAITQAFCKDRKKPLLLGSIKSNMGHSEPPSGLCGITKVIIAMETGFIPPNLHYKNPREGVESLVNGQLKVNIYITLQYLQRIFILSHT